MVKLVPGHKILHPGNERSQLGQTDFFDFFVNVLEVVVVAEAFQTDEKFEQPPNFGIREVIPATLRWNFHYNISYIIQGIDHQNPEGHPQALHS